MNQQKASSTELRADPSFQRAVAKRLKAGSGIAPEMAVLGEMLAQDPEYLWSWHCNLVMAYIDSGGDRRTANEASQRFLYNLAHVDVSKHPEYIRAMQQLTQ